MKKFTTCFFLFLFLASIAAQPTQYQQAITESRQLMQEVTQRTNVPGAAITVSVKGEIVWSEGFGYADLEHSVMVKPEATKFRIGSVSKPITAAALGILYDEGKIDLDAPIQKYVPDFPEKRWPITLRQLAGHIAGIRHYRGQEFLSSKNYPTVDEGLEIFANDTLLFEPGTKYSYSSYGWNLISAAIEEAAGEDFLSYMTTHVFEPLEMKSTTPDYTDSLILNRTDFYISQPSGPTLNAPYVDNSYKWAGGGFLSTSEDLVRFGYAHIHPGFLSEKTLKLWQLPQQTSDGESTNYGIGWRTMQDDNGNRWVGHSGGSVGGITQLIVQPETEVVVAIVTNSSNVQFNGAHEKIGNLFVRAISK